MSKVYSYTRFSAMKQAEGHSAERQAAYAAKWAAEHGLTLDTSLSLRDEGLSAYHQRHIKTGALGAFLQAVEQGTVPKGSFLIVEGLDRLSRAEPIQAQAQLAQIVNAGITVVTASDGKQYSREKLKENPMDLVYSLLVMIRAHEESDTKSKRVRAAFRKMCEAWVAGSYRGLIRQGVDPSWLTLDEEGKWQFIPDRAEAMRESVKLYGAGWGVRRIRAEMERRGLPPIAGNNPSRLLALRSLIGEKEVTVDGETFRLEGYYPPLITREQWDEMQAGAANRKITRDRSDSPGILTGSGTLKCGYCGGALCNWNHVAKVNADGTMPAYARRIRCHNVATGHGCGGKDGAGSKYASGTVVPFERALMSYCSDMMNLRSLYEGDRTAGPKARLAEARAAIADIDAKLEKLLSVIMEMDKAPASFAAKARKLEADKVQQQAVVEQCERELSQVARINLKGMDAQWRALADGVEAQDYEARMKARKLVGDTFERIALYWTRDENGFTTMVLRAKGGTTRVLLIDKKGNWQHGEDIYALPELKVA